ncbi:MAG: 50S ribosomal protein L3 [Parcubacteria group bacterium]
MKSLIAKKVNMTQIFDELGRVTAVTLLQAEEITGFEEGETVEVVGISKGKGFQGVVKRHKFKGGRRSHGQKHSEREAGSIGGGGRAGGRVAKGMRMAGRMGGDRVTVKNLKIVKIIPESNEIFISGAIPGRRGTKIMVKQNSSKNA